MIKKLSKVALLVTMIVIKIQRYKQTITTSINRSNSSSNYSNNNHRKTVLMAAYS